jgi:hypothetical protein
MVVKTATGAAQSITDLADRPATCSVMLRCVERLDEAALMHDTT